MEFSGARRIADLTENELRAYACEHVLYEITHFVRAVQAIELAHAGRFPMNFAVEVFALHLRNLLDFFAPRSIRPTDACAKHFFTGWRSPELTETLDRARWMSDKQIAHLTTSRTADPDEKAWDVAAIVSSIVPTVEQFSKGANLVCDEFRELVQARLAELPQVFFN